MADLASEILVGFAIDASPKWRVLALTLPGQPMPFFDKPTIATQASVTVKVVGFDDPLVVYYSDAVAACERRAARQAREHFARHGRLSEKLLLVCMDLAMKARKTRRDNYKYHRHLEKRAAKLAAQADAL